MLFSVVAGGGSFTNTWPVSYIYTRFVWLFYFLVIAFQVIRVDDFAAPSEQWPSFDPSGHPLGELGCAVYEHNIPGEPFVTVSILIDIYLFRSTVPWILDSPLTMNPYNTFGKLLWRFFVICWGWKHQITWSLIGRERKSFHNLATTC